MVCQDRISGHHLTCDENVHSSPYQISETISYLTERGINVMGQIGLLPQSIKNYINIKIKGFNTLEKKKLIDDAYTLYKAGAFAIVIEAVAESAAKAVVKKN